jgi:hypothetical protein
VETATAALLACVIGVNFYGIHEVVRRIFRPDPKPAKRVVDKAAIRAYRLKHPWCEYQLDSGLECGRPMSDVHHLIHRSQGGGDVESNLISLCREHHRVMHGERVHFAA